MKPRLRGVFVYSADGPSPDRALNMIGGHPPPPDATGSISIQNPRPCKRHAHVVFILSTQDQHGNILIAPPEKQKKKTSGKATLTSSFQASFAFWQTLQTLKSRWVCSLESVGFQHSPNCLFPCPKSQARLLTVQEAVDGGCW